MKLHVIKQLFASDVIKWLSCIVGKVSGYSNVIVDQQTAL